jgi:DNA-binding winged helix-turn-helix (wHTH) protein/predicted ATPase
MTRFGAYRLDRAQGLWREKEEVRITPKSLALLCALVDRAGEIVSKEELFRLVWEGAAVSDSALTSCIQELRRALDDDAQHPRFIETVHRRGYRFREQTVRDNLAPSGHVSFPPRAAADNLIIGRNAIVEDMLNAFALAERGRRQVLFVTGEPGIGKTTVLRAFGERLATLGPARAAWGQCVQHYGASESYQPLLEALSRVCHLPGGEDVIPILERYSPTWLAQLPGLLEPDRLERLQRITAGITRERMLRELNDALEAITAEMPLALWLEDLHWSDMPTLDWIAAFAQRSEPACLLLIGTLRPLLTASPEHPLTTIVDDLRMKGFCREIAVRGLDESDVADYVALRLPSAPGHAERLRRLGKLIHQQTGGNPLFVVNVIEDLAARGLVASDDGQWTLTREVSRAELGMPDDIRRMIGKQIDRLSPAERDVLESASVAGASFSTAAVAAAAGRSLEDVESMLSTMARQSQFVGKVGPIEWPDGTRNTRFEFLHALYCDVLYQRVPASRVAHLHEQVGIRTESGYGDRAPEIAAELAMHFERCGELHRVATYLQRAAENAWRRGACAEAEAHLDRALALLACEPPGPERSTRELELQISRGAVIMAGRGFGAPEVADAFSRARKLSRELDGAPHLFPAVWGLWLYYWGRGPLSTARELVNDLMELAAQAPANAAERLQAHHAAWATAFNTGDIVGSCEHSVSGLGVYDPSQHSSLAATYGSHDAGICGLNFRAWALSLRGQCDEAHRVSEQSVAWAHRLGHPFSLALTHFFAAAAGHTRRDTSVAKANARAGVAVARGQDFRLVLAQSLVVEGWTAVDEGRFHEGLNQITTGLAEFRATGAYQFLPYLLSLSAQAHLKYGDASKGKEALVEAFAAAELTGERFWEAELHRLKGELRLAAKLRGAGGEAEQCFVRAIDVATRQGANLLVLRASVSLGGLLRQLGREAEARRRVNHALGDISQGLALPDVTDARAFLAAS